jgi:uncharacterized membrane protein YgaE (UPF0421/DUF939 family)
VSKSAYLLIVACVAAAVLGMAIAAAIGTVNWIAVVGVVVVAALVMFLIRPSERRR